MKTTKIFYSSTQSSKDSFVSNEIVKKNRSEKVRTTYHWSTNPFHDSKDPDVGYCAGSGAVKSILKEFRFSLQSTGDCLFKMIVDETCWFCK